MKLKTTVVVDMKSVGGVEIGNQEFTLNIDAPDVSVTFDEDLDPTVTVGMYTAFKSRKTWTLPDGEQEDLNKKSVSSGVSTQYTLELPLTDWKVVKENEYWRVMARACATIVAKATLKKAFWSQKWYVEATIDGSVEMVAKTERKKEKGGTEMMAGLVLVVALGLFFSMAAESPLVFWLWV